MSPSLSNQSSHTHTLYLVYQSHPYIFIWSAIPSTRPGKITTITYQPANQHGRLFSTFTGEEPAPSRTRNHQHRNQQKQTPPTKRRKQQTENNQPSPEFKIKSMARKQEQAWEQERAVSQQIFLFLSSDYYIPIPYLL